MTSLLDMRHLQAFYGEAQVVYDLSLSIGVGEVVALLGRNGAGKSTSLKAVMGFVQARAEHLTLGGRDLLKLPPYRIASLGLGYVPEDRRIFTDLTVMENLEVGRRVAKDARAPWTPERLFALFPNLAEMRRRRGGEMSGGEQQMLAIARALMGNPRVILLDEPSEGLAPAIVKKMAQAILEMKSEGVAVLLAEQNWTFASAVSDRVCLIERGEAKFLGPAKDLSEELRAEFLGV